VANSKIKSESSVALATDRYSVSSISDDFYRVGSDLPLDISSIIKK
jgi:hypothetical protein